MEVDNPRAQGLRLTHNRGGHSQVWELEKESTAMQGEQTTPELLLKLSNNTRITTEIRRKKNKFEFLFISYNAVPLRLTIYVEPQLVIPRAAVSDPMQERALFVL